MPSVNFSNSLHWRFLEEFRLGIPPGVPSQISFRSSYRLSSVDSFRSSLWRLLQEFHLEILQEFHQWIPPSGNYGKFLQEFFLECSIPTGDSSRFLSGNTSRSSIWKYLQELSLGNSSRSSHWEFLQVFPVEIIPWGLSGKSSKCALREFLKQFALKIPPGVPSGSSSWSSIWKILQVYVPRRNSSYSP